MNDDFAREHGKLKYPKGTEIAEFPIDTSDWETRGETLAPTLGF